MIWSRWSEMTAVGPISKYLEGSVQFEDHTLHCENWPIGISTDNSLLAVNDAIIMIRLFVLY